MNRDKNDEVSGFKSINPFDKANWLSKFCYWWLRDLFKIGLSRQVIEDDMYPCVNNQKSEYVSKRFELLWNEELNKAKPSLFNIIMKMYGYKTIIVGFLFSAVELPCSLISPLLMGYLIAYFTNNPYEHTEQQAYFFATALAVSLILIVLVFHPAQLFYLETGVKLRVACCSLIYKKILSLTKYTMTDGLAGQAINLMSNDVSRFDWMICFACNLWNAPVGTGVAGYLIYTQIGYAGLVGIAVLIMSMPVQAWLGKKSAQVRLQTALRTDKRVKFMFSIINGIQVIKMYAWEISFGRIIKAVRKHEINAIGKSFNIKAALLSFQVATDIALFLSLVTYVYTGNSITAQKTFVTIAYFNYINHALVDYWPLALTSVAEGFISVKRVEKFLLHKVAEKTKVSDISQADESLKVKKGVTLKNATAYWKQESETSSVGIQSVDAVLGDHNLIAICGQVGSGKSTLLEVILKELPLTNGELIINGTISYAAQQNWIFEGSVKRNITFTSDFDSKRYKAVIHACELERDLELLPHGDETIVGDRGISLSGGQKARINLARAIYKKADIYLLDDPLSAVDVQVGHHIFERVNWEEIHGESINSISIEENSGIIDPNWWTTERFVYFYTGGIVALTIFMTCRSFAFYHMSLRISMNLHDQLFKGVTRAIMFFFHSNSTGRILNRFSKDMGTIDSLLPTVVIDCIIFFLQLFGIVIIVSIVNYWLMIPTLVMFVLFIVLRYLFLKTARDVKRIEAITRSPMFTHTTATLEGLSTIRAFNSQSDMINEYDHHQNVNSSSWFLFVATARGFAFYVDFISSLYITSIIYSFLVLGTKNTIGSNVGLAITQAINLIGMCNWGLRQTAELENQMTSVERVVEYTKLQSERSLETDPRILKTLPKSWPNQGVIQFNEVSFKYSDDADYVLRNLNFIINEKEKVGIVGRTGAGKSSITQAIFQLGIVDGVIAIDGVDINNLGLHTFREKLSIIPQDPILFVGSLRDNLDPLNTRNDDEIWQVLEQVELKEVVKSLSGLDTKVVDGGSNFSTGQKQLICLARAILKKNKILIMDEATANIDSETDNLIQTTIRSQFNNCTVITVAHRLHTVLDSDRIMVLDAGKIMEFDTPRKLLDNKQGIFFKLFNEAGLDFDSLKQKNVRDKLE
ncbi:CLUMA_CG020730, isoform A [Clunio marinus]|uniref:CLUMA_CG020730, isoform A n=1 Tax=Clunio marinus TaxID=568069 RepID=A0A1J1J5V0_9DIPT|nr:CLUMA_CG020730, isoform A [Clunio marinus]